MKVLHVITGLDTGGAEIMLYKLLSEMADTDVCNEVVSLTTIGPIGEKILSLGVSVRALGLKSGAPNPFRVIRLARWINLARPNVVQSWMYHADLIGGLAAKLAGSVPIAWGIHNSSLAVSDSKTTTRLTAKLCAGLSSLVPTSIVCCSQASQRFHRSIGYAGNRMTVIPNGFDLDLYRPDPISALNVRRELGIRDGAILIGLVGRFSPEKDHANFVEAAGRLLARVPEVHFLLCGDGVSWGNERLAASIDALGVRKSFHLLGRRSDVPRLTAALDIASSSSYSEGFSNVIGEGMACAVPCVVTDVGDSGLIVGEAGRVVPPRNPDALAAAWLDLIECGKQARRQLGEAARIRVEEHFNIRCVASRYKALYAAMVAQ